MGLAGTGSPDQNEVMGIFSELSGAEGVDPGLGDGGGTHKRGTTQQTYEF